MIPRNRIAPKPMPFDAWLTAVVVSGLFLLLAFTRTAPDMAFIAAVAILLIAGVIGPGEALRGFGNPGVITVGALYVVVAGIRDTGGLQWLVHNLLGRPGSAAAAQLRITAPVTVMSAFLNNTPVVALLIPAISDWARRYQLSVSRLMLPLSYAAILGGTCTLIGTSTNLVVNGLMLERGEAGLGLFELAWVGVPVALAGLATMLMFHRRLFPDRRPVLEQLEDPREYTLEMVVTPDGPLVGCSIEDAGLRHLPGAFLIELDRAGCVIPAVSPQQELRGGDRLIFAGVVESMVDLQKIRGLQPATRQVFKLEGHRADRRLAEAVVSDSSPLVGRSIREGGFRDRYNAVVIAIGRNGERLSGKIGDQAIKAGDTLLLEAPPGALERRRNSRDFFLIRPLGEPVAPRHERAVLALSILFAAVSLVGLGVITMLEGALAAAGLMLLGRCLTVSAAREAIDWPVLLTIAAAFGIGAAMEATGLANVLALGLIGFAGQSPWFNLLAIYLTTALFTALLTNNAAAVLMFPIAWALAGDLGVSPLPYVIAIMLAASASFATPFGYQTNLMVYGPGGYRFGDYLRAGIPMSLVTAAVAVGVLPLVWGFG